MLRRNVENMYYYLTSTFMITFSSVEIFVMFLSNFIDVFAFASIYKMLHTLQYLITVFNLITRQYIRRFYLCNYMNNQLEQLRNLVKILMAVFFLFSRFT